MVWAAVPLRPLNPPLNANQFADGRIFIPEDLRKATRRLGITVGFIILLHFGDADVGVDHKYCKYDAGKMIEYGKGCTGRILDSLRLEVSGY